MVRCGSLSCSITYPTVCTHTWSLWMWLIDSERKCISIKGSKNFKIVLKHSWVQRRPNENSLHLLDRLEVLLILLVFEITQFQFIEISLWYFTTCILIILLIFVMIFWEAEDQGYDVTFVFYDTWIIICLIQYSWQNILI